MDLLPFKLIASPLLLLVATLAVRRWGESIGGFFVGLPLTSGPISLFLALEQGAPFARDATAGSLTATAAQAAAVWAYCLLATRGCMLAILGSSLAFSAVAWPLQAVGWPQGVLFAIALASVAGALRFSPITASERRVTTPAWWDLPARIVLMVTLVLGVTAAAPGLGPQVSGVLASFPFMGVILAVFAHHIAGPGAGQSVMRGMCAGLVGFGAFFFVLSLMLTRVSIPLAYSAALSAALGTQASSLRLLRQQTVLGAQGAVVE